MNLWSYSYRELRRRPGRTLLTLAGIALGVAAIVAVSLVTTATKSAYREMFAAVSGEAELEVVAQGTEGLETSLDGRLASVDGVEAVVPVVQSPSALVTDLGRTVVVVLGVDPERDLAARRYEVTAGESFFETAGSSEPVEPAGNVPVMLEESFARSQDLGPGDGARLITPQGTAEVEVVALVDAAGTAAFNGGAIVFMPLPQAQELFSLGARVNSLQLVLGEGASLSQVEEAVSAVLPAGTEVRSPEARGAVAEDSMLSTEQGLNSLSALSIAAAVFIVVNAFFMSLTGRNRDLAVLRTLGVTRRQLVRLVLREAVVLGSVGTVLGLLGGIGGAYVLMLGVEQLMGVELGGFALSAGPLLGAAALGLGSSLLSAYVPARWAARVPPLEGLSGEAREDRGRRRRWPSYLGVTFLVLVLAILAGLRAHALDEDVTALAMVLLLVGLVLLIPPALAPLTWLAARLLGPFLGTEGRIAFRQLNRHPTRTALTVGVLFVAVTIGIGMGSALVNNISDTGDWYERTIVGDYFVRGALPEIGTNLTATMSPEVGAEIAAIEGVRAVDAIRFLPGTIEDESVVILARSFELPDSLPLDLEEGESAEVLEGLRRGGIVLGTALAGRLGLGVGDQVTAATAQGPVELTVEGTATEYTAGGSAAYVSWDTGERLFGLDGSDVYLVHAEEGALEAVGQQLEELTQERGLLLQSFAEFRTFLDEMVAGVMAFLWVLLAVVFVIASLGIVNTLSVSVLEQTRELGLLRAVALTRRQVRKTVLSQALAIALVSLVPGAVVGIAVAILLNVVTGAVIGQPVDLSVNPIVVISALVVGFVAAVVSAYLPARRAARLEIVKALQYE